MGATSVTGIGSGSADGTLRGRDLDYARKITGLSATQIGDGSISNEEFQYLAGLTGNVQQQINSGVAVPNVVTVNKAAGDVFHGSLAAAVASITDSSSSNRYVVRVGPGLYTEPLITVPEFVFIVGDHIDAVVVMPDSTEHHIFQLSNRSGIVNLTIQGSGVEGFLPTPGAGKAGVYSHDVGSFCLLHKVTIKNCSIGVLHESHNLDSYLYLEYVDFTDCDTTAKCTNLGSFTAALNCENLYFEYLLSNAENAIICDGSHSEVSVFLANCTGADTTGTAFLVKDGGRLIITSTRIRGWNRGVYAIADAGTPYLNLSDISFGITDYNNINLDIANSNASGVFTGYSEYDKTVINKSNTFFVSNNDERTIIVAKKGGDFSSVKAAMEAITDSSYSSRYNIIVGPGEFTEDTIVMKDYVSISGDETRSSIIQLNPESAVGTNLIENPATCNTTIRKVLLRNATSGAAYKYYGGVCRLEQVRFGDNKYGVDAYDVVGEVQNSLDLSNCSCARASDIDLLFKISDDGTHPLSVLVSHFSTNDSEDKMKKVAEIGIVSGAASGQNTEVEFIGCTFIGDGTDTAIKVADGVDFHMLASQIVDFNIGVHLPQEGNGPEIEMVGSLIYDNASYDLLFEHPLATGVASVTCDKDKVSSVDLPDSKIAMLIQDHSTGALVVTGDYYQGNTYANITNVTETITKEPTIGRMSGGETSIVSGRTISVAAGAGYVYINDSIKYVTWNQKTFVSGAADEIPANSNLNIYVDADGNVSHKAAFANIYTEIFLARVVTDASSVVMLVDTYRDAIVAGTKYDRLFRLYLGPIYRTGSVTSIKSGAGNERKLVVTSGDYAFSTRIFAPSGGSPITFASWYPNGAWYTITKNLTDVPNTHYYNQVAGDLAELQADHYVKHALYTYGDGTSEKYFLVYGEEDFEDLLAAQAGDLPATPTPLTVSAVLIAAIIIQKGQNLVSSNIIDQRPTLVTRVSSVTAASVHGNLSGLEADDHPQYALADGSGRSGGSTFTGNVNMDNHNIITSGTIGPDGDGVYIANHHARHLPGSGTDALHTAAPNSNLSAVSTNTEGVQASFSRSDHTHAITAYSTNTVSSLVKRDASGNFSAGIITSDLVGNVTGNADTATNFTGNLDGDVSGTQSVTVVDSVGGSTASAIHQSVLDTAAATNLATPSTLIKRDGSGNFSAVRVTANLTGNVTGSADSATNITGNLTGEVTSVGMETTVAYVNGVAASSIASGATAANNAVSTNVASRIVKRDGSGNFSAGTITANLTGDVTGSATTAGSITGNLTGDVTSNGMTTTVAYVGEVAASSIASGATAANNAVSTNTASRIVKRDGSGNFLAGTITANLTGDVTGNVSGTAANVTGVIAVANGGTNSSTALSNHRVMVSNSGAIKEAAAITASRALASDTNGIPVASATTAAELGYLSGVSSSVQNQLDSMALYSELTDHTTNTSNPHTTTLEQARSANNQISGNIDANGYTMTNVAYPLLPGDICNKQYADETASGLSVKDPVRLATTTSLTSTYSAITKKLTATSHTKLTIDTKDVVSEDRILVKDQVDKKQNGIYVVSDPGAADPDGSAWILTRASDFDTSAEITNGTFVLVTDGDVNKNSGYVLTTLPPITLDTSELNWSQFSKTADISPGVGLALNGTAFDVQVDDTTIAISGNELIVKAGGIGNTQLDKANISLSGFGVPTGDISMATNKITNLKAPTGDNDAARKVDVDNVQSNLTAHIGAGGAAHAQVTTSVDGFMIAADKLKLDSATNNNTASAIVKRDGSGNFSAGTITASLTGSVTGNVTGNCSGTAATFTGSLTGDVTSTGMATTVALVGGVAASSIASGATAANNATSVNTVDRIVIRDGSGNFSAGTITASLTGNVTGNCSGTAATFTGSLTGDVTSTGMATTVALVNGVTAANIATGATAANNATSTNTVSRIVIRDGNGDFAAGNITATLLGNATSATTATNFSGSLSGDVTGTQGSTTVATVGGKSASTIASTVNDVAAATATNTNSTIVKRDGSGGFAGGTISATSFSGPLTGNVTGNVTGNCSGTAATFTGSLTGDVTSTGMSTTVAYVNGVTAANIATGATAANNATSTNTVSRIVIRDSNGDFAARNITASSFIGPLTGNVTGTASGNVPYTGATGDVNLGSNNLTTTGTITANNFVGPVTTASYYGGMYNSGTSTTVNIVVAGTYYQIASNFTAQTLNGFTFQNNRELVVGFTGVYNIMYSITIAGNASNHLVGGSYMINGTASTISRSVGFSTTTSRPDVVAGSAMVSLTAGQLISLCVTDLGGTGNATVTYATLTLVKVG